MHPLDPVAPIRPYVDHPVTDVVAATRAAGIAAREWGLDEPRLVRLGMNGIFVAGNEVLRVSSPTVDAVHSIDLARMLLDRGLRVARPRRPEAVRSGGFDVTCWEQIAAVGQPIDWCAVGAMVRRVHEIDIGDVPSGYPVPTPAAFPWWDFDALIAETREAIDPAALDGLLDAIERWRGWEEFDDTVLCHGDVHPGNVVMAQDGPVLIDWDLLCRAPEGWDHAPLMTWGDRWGGCGDEYIAFGQGYGRSMVGEHSAEAFAELRLVAATLMRVRAGLTDPDAGTEADRRLRYWAGDPDAPAWRAQ
jgi:hypothetical protein